MIESLRTTIPHEEFDYQTLLQALDGYASPRDRITRLLRRGVIVRVRKGLYIFGEACRRRPVSRELLANLIRGPSYVSLEFALARQGIIPEQVHAVTSVTTGRARRFHTPVGLFLYRTIPLEAYRVGMDRVEVGDGRSFLIALPEKALADQVRGERGLAIRSREEMAVYLRERLRVDETALARMDPRRLEDYAERYRSRRIEWLRDVVQGLRPGGEGNGGA